MNIILATGRPDLDDTIKELLKNVKVVGEIHYRKGVVDLVELRKPDVIIMSDLLDDDGIKMKDLLLTLRLRFPLVRIIYLLKEENPREKAFLYHWSIFDVLSSSFKIRDLENLLNKQKVFADVHEEMIILEKYKKEMDKDPTGEFTEIDGNGYHSPFEQAVQQTQHIQQEVVAFWSPLEQAGKTFSAVNTAISLANNPNLQILLLDFNIRNPNVNLYFNFKDPDRNLSALIEDLEDGDELTKELLDDYLVQHPAFPNLKILPGYILRRELPNEETLTSVFTSIIDIVKKANYSTILVDTEAAIHTKFQANLLNQCSKIILHIAENPSSYYGVVKIFDNLYGTFSKNSIHQKKLIPVITHSYDETFSDFKLQIETFLAMRVLVTFDYSTEIRLCSFGSTPIMKDMPPDNIYDMFIILCNQIHPNIFMKPIKPIKPKPFKDKKNTKDKKKDEPTNEKKKGWFR